MVMRKILSFSPGGIWKGQAPSETRSAKGGSEVFPGERPGDPPEDKTIRVVLALLCMMRKGEGVRSLPEAFFDIEDGRHFSRKFWCRIWCRFGGKKGQKTVIEEKHARRGLTAVS